MQEFSIPIYTVLIKLSAALRMKLLSVHRSALLIKASYKVELNSKCSCHGTTCCYTDDFAVLHSFSSHPYIDDTL